MHHPYLPEAFRRYQVALDIITKALPEIQGVIEKYPKVFRHTRIHKKVRDRAEEIFQVLPVWMTCYLDTTYDSTLYLTVSVAVANSRETCRYIKYLVPVAHAVYAQTSETWETCVSGASVPPTWDRLSELEKDLELLEIAEAKARDADLKYRRLKLKLTNFTSFR